MKLYDLEKGERFIINSDEEEKVFLFDHLDGMFSICYLGGKIVNIIGHTDVKKVE